MAEQTFHKMHYKYSEQCCFQIMTYFCFLLLLFIMAIYRYILTGTLEEIKITSHNVFYNSHQEKICNYILKSYCLL